MNQTIITEQKQSALLIIESIHAVDGFNPMSLAIEFDNLNDGTKRYHLPVKVQMAWFRLKYPEGKIAVSVKPTKEFFIAEARVYANHKDSVDCFLAEGSASRGYSSENPTISPREWAQTAAIGMALRNAGFGLNADFAGESFEGNTLNELISTSGNAPDYDEPLGSGANVADNASEAYNANEAVSSNPPPASAPDILPDLTPLDLAMMALCPITKYKGKTLGDMIRIDPGALAYIAKSGEKYGDLMSNHAKLICEYATQQVSA